MDVQAEEVYLNRQADKIQCIDKSQKTGRNQVTGKQAYQVQGARIESQSSKTLF